MRHDEPPLPRLEKDVLDEAGVDALFARVAGEGEDVVILLKGDVFDHSTGDPVTLEKARELFREGRVYGVQLRYRVGEEAWLDTLMHVPHGLQLVRMRQPF